MSKSIPDRLSRTSIPDRHLNFAKTVLHSVAPTAAATKTKLNNQMTIMRKKAIDVDDYGILCF